MSYLVVAIFSLLLGAGAVLIGLHKMTDGEIWSLFGSSRDDGNSYQPTQPVQHENPADRYDPFKQQPKKQDPYI